MTDNMPKLIAGTNPWSRPDRRTVLEAPQEVLEAGLGSAGVLDPRRAIGKARARATSLRLHRDGGYGYGAEPGDGVHLIALAEALDEAEDKLDKMEDENYALRSILANIAGELHAVEQYTSEH